MSHPTKETIAHIRKQISPRAREAARAFVMAVSIMAWVLFVLWIYGTEAHGQDRPPVDPKGVVKNLPAVTPPIEKSKQGGELTIRNSGGETNAVPAKQQEIIPWDAAFTAKYEKISVLMDEQRKVAATAEYLQNRITTLIGELNALVPPGHTINEQLRVFVPATPPPAAVTPATPPPPVITPSAKPPEKKP